MRLLTAQLRRGLLALGLAAGLLASAQAQIFLAITDGGGIYTVDLQNYTSTLEFTTGHSQPNGLAWDAGNNVAFFATGAGTQLNMWNAATNSQVAVGNSNLLTGNIWDAAFYGGYFWYVDSGSDDLYRVEIDVSDKLNPFVSDVTVFEDFNGAAGNLAFGDITITPDGTLYGATTSGQLFSVDVSGASPTGYTVIGNNGVSLQIAWSEGDGMLYGKGYQTSTDWVTIDLTDASLTPVDNGSGTYNLPNGVRDLAMIPVPEPMAGGLLAAGGLLLLARRRLKNSAPRPKQP